METVTAPSVPDVQAPTASCSLANPVPMSFPAILRNPGIANRFAHLRVGLDKGQGASPAPVKKNRREDKEGKRWVRRRDNARFVGNPHIVAASKKDFSIVPPSNRATFPHPLPTYLSRNTAIPPAQPGKREPNSANAGRFTLSLKGMRRELRKSPPRTQQLVQEIEHQLVGWLGRGGVLLDPDAALTEELSLPGTPIGSSEAIREVSRTPLQLVWCTTDDAFARYVVHCCARFYNVVSFSKDTFGHRLTYLLRPNVARPDHSAPAALDTPPVTELESSAHEFDTDDFISDRDGRSDMGDDSELEGAPPPGALSDIAESLPNSPAILAAPPPQDSDEAWSVLGESDRDAGEESGSELDLASSVGSLSLREPSFVSHLDSRVRPSPLRSPLWNRQRRSASSPSRSPARRMPLRSRPRVESPASGGVQQCSFYDYLFA